jgi:hypothetical protein
MKPEIKAAIEELEFRMMAPYADPDNHTGWREALNLIKQELRQGEAQIQVCDNEGNWTEIEPITSINFNREHWLISKRFRWEGEIDGEEIVAYSIVTEVEVKG